MGRAGAAIYTPATARGIDSGRVFILIVIRRPESTPSSKRPEEVLEFHGEGRGSDIHSGHCEGYRPRRVSECFYVDPSSEDMAVQDVSHSECRVEIRKVQRRLIRCKRQTLNLFIVGHGDWSGCSL